MAAQSQRPLYRVVLFTLLSGLALRADVVAQQPSAPPSGQYGGLSSRFIPTDIWTRMLERPEDAPSSFTVTASRDSAWVALQDAFKQLDVPLDFSDKVAGEMGTVRAKLYRRLGKAPVSDFLRCGEGISGPNADSYVVYLSVVGFVRPAQDGGTTVVALITGQAVDLPNGRNDVVPCTTTGKLEDKVAKSVIKRLGGSR